jgi:hypothetical protein
MDKKIRDYLRKIGRKGGTVVTPKKVDALARARAAKAAKRKATKKGRATS